MSLIHQTFHTEGIAMLSYLIGDDATGEAAVIDPRPDPEIYLAAARHHGLAITHILETHIHADFMSGSRELAAAAPGARIHVSGEGDPDYGFEHHSLRDGDQLELGVVVLTARHTPGHTPEHLSYEAADPDRAGEPWGVFTGDSLFVGSAGRPDLLGSDQARDLAHQLHATLRDYFMKLPDGVLVLPGHGAGSPCGAGIGDRKVSTIGHEKRNVVRLLLRVGLTRFGGYLAGGMDAWARAGLPMNDLPQQTVHDLAADLEKETNLQLLDVRTEEEFEAGRIDGAKHLFVPEVAGKAAEMMDPSVPVVTYCGSGYRASIAASILQREGFEKVRNVPGSWLAWQAMQQ